MKKIGLFITTAALLISSSIMPAFASTSSPYVESDTTVDFTLAQGKTYAYKMTVHGTHANPRIVAGNGNVLRTESVTHRMENGNDVYYFKVRAIGKQGQATGVYTTLPNQKSVRHSDITIPYQAGFYHVGVDIPEGKYCLQANQTNISEGVYFIRQSSDIDSTTIDCDAFCDRDYISVSNGQYLEVKYSSFIPANNVSRLFPSNGKYKASEYRVGIDIPAGKYIITPYKDEEAYVALHKDVGNNIYGIITNANISSPHTISVYDGQYLQVERGSIIKES